MKTVIILYCVMVGIVFGTIIMSSFLFNYFPKSRLSNWWKKHIVTDVDLERIPPPSDGSDS